MKLSDKVKAVQNELIDALCNIKEMPESGKCFAASGIRGRRR